MAARTGWRMLAVFACGLVGVAGGTRAWAAETKEEVLDAEMLKDLDLLKEVNMAQQRDLLRRLAFWERLQMLERLRLLESPTPPDPTVKEEK